jgi:hypothetical protein
VAGESLEPLLVRSALRRLSEERPFLESMNFTGSSAQVEFWDEGESMLDVASLALRFWNEHRDSAGLPKWEVVGLEVMEKTVKAAGGGGRTVEPSMRVPAPFTF